MSIRIILICFGVGILIFLLKNLFFPKPVEKKFRYFILSALKETQKNLSQVLTHPFDSVPLANSRLAWPLWVNSPYFNDYFREGFTFFLQKLNHINEIVFSVCYLISCLKEEEKLQFFVFKKYLKRVQKEFDLIFSALIDSIESFKTLTFIMDMKNIFKAFEKKFSSCFPYSLEILEDNDAGLWMANLITSLEDIYMLLQQLGESLQDYKHVSIGRSVKSLSSG